MSQSAINIMQVAISAGSGAVAGALVSFLAGPTIAEREERGRSRVSARRAIGRALQSFRYNLSNLRLILLEDQPPEAAVLVDSAFDLATEVYAALPIVSWPERKRLERAIGALIGREMLEVARLRPRERGANELSDAARAFVAQKYRSEPTHVLTDLLSVDPLAREWESITRRGEKLSRRYR
jgi:hypothetical protein